MERLAVYPCQQLGGAGRMQLCIGWQGHSGLNAPAPHQCICVVSSVTMTLGKISDMAEFEPQAFILLILPCDANQSLLQY